MPKSNNDGWKKVEMAPAWDFKEEYKGLPEADKKAEVGVSVQGIFTGMDEDVGDNHSKMYHLEQDNGKDIAVWGNTVLDLRMKNVKMGEEVKIVYLGQAKSEKVKGRTYHNFEVYHKPAPFKKVEDEVDLDDIDLSDLDDKR